ncbi:MAG: UDP-N-acetylmuramoyl-L-alanine--D-glutamate ligase [Helicobacteraceae bacterium]|nr:UDP-N-acetylmuramoyl-L-alanine--D-glutamate ligase [Helicobacteraceae bacterium]
MISLFGYGQTMKALSKILSPCNIYDEKFHNKSKDEFGNNLLPIEYFDSKDSSLEIISPGIPPTFALNKKARNLISEYDYFYPNNALNIWISGTNGKTTTTQMTQSLLSEFGSVCGGNIGIPLCNLDKNAKIWILETSSFTLHYTNKANPKIYALLPITQDHISWHGSFENYVDAKLKPIKLMSKDSYAIIPSKYRDKIKDFRGNIYFYSNTSSLAKEFDIDEKKINFRGVFLLDAIMALCIARILINKIDYNIINNFIIDSHKIEEFRDKNGRLFIDDSKATNIDATLNALEIYKDKKIFLILGGDNKGVSLKPLISKLTSYNVTIFAIGKCSSEIMQLARIYNISCKDSNTLKNAIDSIKNIFSDNKNSVCLLSPACASLDQFTSYKHRGEEFKRYALL